MTQGAISLGGRRGVTAILVIVTALGAASVGAATFGVPDRIQALPGPSESTVVTVEPTRILDTRVPVGLPGKIESNLSSKLVVTGTIPTYVGATETTTNKQVVPAGATGVLMNVTAVSPTSRGFLSIRPGDATGTPATSGLNFVSGDVVPNSVTVAVPTAGPNAGQIDVHFGGAPGNTMHVLIDIVGYTTPSGLADLTERLQTLESSGVAGPAGADGADGLPGVDGSDGLPGDDGSNGLPGIDGAQGPIGPRGVDPSKVIWVAKADGDYTLLSDALAAIGVDPKYPAATATDPYLIKIAPGTYDEGATTVDLKSFVDIEGSGQGTTTITCACGVNGTIRANATTGELRHLTVANTGGGGTDATAIVTQGVVDGSFSLLHVTATATGGTNSNTGVSSVSSSPTMTDVTATATGGTNRNTGVSNSSSSPTMTDVTATATGDGAGVINSGVTNVSSSSPVMTNVVATATGDSNTNQGVRSDSSAPVMINVVATATGTVTNFNYAVANFSSSPIITNLTTVTPATGFSRGVDNLGTSAPVIRNSIIDGNSSSIRNGAGSSVTITDSTLENSVTGSGSGFNCVAVLDAMLTLLGPDCLTAPDPAPDPAQVIWVATSGGDYTKLSDALAAIGVDPKYPAATAADPYLIKIAPGTYDEGTTTVNLKSFVDIEGSGQGATIITCDCATGTDALTDDSSATVSAPGPLTAEVRHLTIENTGGGDHSTGVHTTSAVAQSFSLLHVTVEATAGAVSSWGIVNDGSSPAITNATVSGFGPADPRGVSNNGTSSPILTNVVITAGGNLAVGVVNDSGASPTIRGSSITSSPFDILNISGTAIVTNTALGGGGASAVGFTCVGVHTTAGVALNATCSAETAQSFSVFADGDQALAVTDLTDAVVRSVTVTAPVSGTVIVNSSNLASEAVAGDQLRCSITVGSTVDFAALQVWESSGTGGGGLGQMSGTRGFNIAAGAAVTYNLVCRHNGTSGSSIVENSSITATFNPNP